MTSPPVGATLLLLSLDSIPGPHNHYYVIRAERWRVEPGGALTRLEDEHHLAIRYQLDYDSLPAVKDIILRHLGAVIGERVVGDIPRLDVAQHLKPARAYLGGIVEELDIKVEPA